MLYRCWLNEYDQVIWTHFMLICPAQKHRYPKNSTLKFCTHKTQCLEVQCLSSTFFLFEIIVFLSIMGRCHNIYFISKFPWILYFTYTKNQVPWGQIMRCIPSMTCPYPLNPKSQSQTFFWCGGERGRIRVRNETQELKTYKACDESFSHILNPSKSEIMMNYGKWYFWGSHPSHAQGLLLAISGDHMGWWGSKLDQLCARQTSNPLCSGPRQWYLNWQTQKRTKADADRN